MARLGMDEMPRVLRSIASPCLEELYPHLFVNEEVEEDMADDGKSDEGDESKKNNKRSQDKNYTVKKRPPLKPVAGDNVIFITRKTNFKAQLDKCSDLLAKGEKELILHALGAAMQRCCNLAIQLQLKFPGTHEIEINTGTLDIIDDLVPNLEELDLDIQYRYQSSVHIRIFRTAMAGAN